MLIRSADKTKIVNLANANLIEIVENHRRENEYEIWIDECKVGKYKKFQRAIEILDEICNAYLSLNKQEGKECRGTYGYFGGYVKNGIYQMPEE